MARRLPIALALLLCGALSDTASAQTTLRGLVVLIDFEDAPATLPLSRANDIINGVGYREASVTRSLRDYYQAQSRGGVVLTHDVVGYFRAPQPAAWYTTQPFDAFIDLTRQALDWVVATHPDFDWGALSLANGPFDRHPDGENGTLLSVNFMSTALVPGVLGTHWLTGWTAPNGVEPRQIVAAMFQAPWDTDVNLFWLTHELGHSIWGWPDTYDNNGVSHGTGLYSLMSGNQGTGDVEPVGGPFLLGERWVRAVEIHRQQTVVMDPDGSTVVVHRNPLDDREYFVIEARQRGTVGNSALPLPIGLLIWHVDERVPLTTANRFPQRTLAQHYRVSLEQADGRFDLEEFVNTGDAGDLFVPGISFTPLSTPDSTWWDGSPSGFRVDSIEFLKNGRIKFRVAVR